MSCLLVPSPLHSTQPGFVVKAKDVNTGKKLFLNLCQNELVGVATAVPSADAGKGAQKWSIPYSLTPPKEDIDSGGQGGGGEGRGR